jgi:RNAse (barnase) inhibitor barstar
MLSSSDYVRISAQVMFEYDRRVQLAWQHFGRSEAFYRVRGSLLSVAAEEYKAATDALWDTWLAKVKGAK